MKANYRWNCATKLASTPPIGGIVETHLERQRVGIGVRGGPGDKVIEIDGSAACFRSKFAGICRWKIRKLGYQRAVWRVCGGETTALMTVVKARLHQRGQDDSFYSA